MPVSVLQVCWSLFRSVFRYVVHLDTKRSPPTKVSSTTGGSVLVKFPHFHNKDVLQLSRS